jgi:hypothetical protein
MPIEEFNRRLFFRRNWILPHPHLILDEPNYIKEATRIWVSLQERRKSGILTRQPIFSCISLPLCDDKSQTDGQSEARWTNGGSLQHRTSDNETRRDQSQAYLDLPVELFRPEPTEESLRQILRSPLPRSPHRNRRQIQTLALTEVQRPSRFGVARPTGDSNGEPERHRPAGSLACPRPLRCSPQGQMLHPSRSRRAATVSVMSASSVSTPTGVSASSTVAARAREDPISVARSSA